MTKRRMRRIILASRSRPRQRLLRQAGLRFTVAEPRVGERHRLGGKSCASLVTANALAKARDAARRFDSGVVIGADTVVLVGRRIIGKPRNLKDAARTLKLLSRRPQWVYTGIAVIDIDNRKTVTDYEKTKVYIYRLSDSEIRDYFKRVSPLDKAGSFDVQGWGSIFIDRVEGCFYNVVGLPLARLARMLKKTGVDIF